VADDDRDRKSEDLFEDLDNFFSSMDDPNWPTHEEGGAPAPAAQAEEPRPAMPPDAPEPDARPEPEARTDPGGEPAVPPLVDDGGPVPEEPAASSEPPPAFEPPPSPTDQPTGEMSGDEWTRLRDVLGDDEPAPDEADRGLGEFFSGTAAEPGGSLFASTPEEDEPPLASASLWGTETPPDASASTWGREPEVWPPTEVPGDEPGDLTLDDLKKAPPEYQDLPGVHTGGDVGQPPAPSGPAEMPGGQAFTPPPASMPAGDPRDPWPGWSRTDPPGAGATGPGPHAPDHEPGPSILEDDPEPSLAEVEAAAKSLASGFGPAQATTTPAGAVEDDLLRDLDHPPGPRTVKVTEPEALLGPTWQEPTSQAVMGEESPPPAGGRNLPAAVITGAVLVAAAAISLALAKWAFAGVAGFVVLLAQAELYATMQRKGHQPATALGLVLGALLLVGAYRDGEAGILAIIALGLVLTLLWFMVAPPKSRTGLLSGIGVTMLGLVYIPGLASFYLVILKQPTYGRVLVMAILALTFVYDIAAFGIGTIWGSRPLAPTISPKKSWEGLFGATVVTFLASVAFLPSINVISLSKAIGLFVVVAVAAPLGDLVESAMKRDLGVKDMGAILPGHGGALDRIDSVLVVAPAAFYFLRVILTR
jgi:phosphatidate cytidylyltransferase